MSLSVPEIAEAFDVSPLIVSSMLKVCGVANSDGQVSYEALEKIEPLLTAKAELPKVARGPRSGVWSKKAEDYFWANVNQNGSKNFGHFGGRCWEWTGKTMTWVGQGNVVLDKAVDGKSFAEANRFVWQIFNGRFADPEAVHVSIKCGNPICCNPEHLRLVAAHDHKTTLVENSHRDVQGVAPILIKKAA